MHLRCETDHLCDYLQQSWKSGAAPEIPAFVERLSTAARLMLLGQRVPVGLEYRLQQSEISKVKEETFRSAL